MEAPSSEHEPLPVRRLDHCLLRFTGALDAATVADALSEIDAVASSRPRRVVVDLADLELLDSSGVRALLTLRERVTSSGGSVVVANASGQPLVVLERLALCEALGLS